MKIISLIAIAGVIGTLARYLSIKTLNQILPDSFWATLGVNTLGAFIAGFCFILCKYKFSDHQEYFPILFIGFLGAFTTFSTFALESISFFQMRNIINFFKISSCTISAASEQLPPDFIWQRSFSKVEWKQIHFYRPS